MTVACEPPAVGDGMFRQLGTCWSERGKLPGRKLLLGGRILREMNTLTPLPQHRVAHALPEQIFPLNRLRP
jgi:hypothetical protein